MDKDVYDEDAKYKRRTSITKITKSDVAVEKLDKILSDYPDMQAAFAPLYSEIRKRDLHWKHRFKDGFKKADWYDYQEHLKKWTMAFMLGWAEKKYKDKQITNMVKLDLSDEEKLYFEAGKKYRQAQEKIEGHDTNDGTYGQIEIVTFNLLRLLADSGD